MDDFFENAYRRRKAAKEMLLREARIGTEWTAPGCGYYCAVVPSVDDPDKHRIVWFDERGPSGHADRYPLDIAEEIIMHFGCNVTPCPGTFDRVTKALAEKEGAECPLM